MRCGMQEACQDNLELIIARCLVKLPAGDS